MEKHIMGDNGISYTLGADESRSRDNGAVKGNRPDEMGWIDEQFEKCCGGNCAEGIGNNLIKRLSREINMAKYR